MPAPSRAWTPFLMMVLRNVRDYGASGHGDVDDSKAINAAIADGNRCGKTCGITFSQGAIIYFPASDPHNRPIIKGCSNFTGMALINTDVYIPGGYECSLAMLFDIAANNQFFRHIRNFEFNLKDMPLKTDDAGQSLATTLQNLKFTMPKGKDVTHVGIFKENGSGGFISGREPLALIACRNLKVGISDYALPTIYREEFEVLGVDNSIVGLGLDLAAMRY
ncbi:hypothetical protein B0T24DRAFT_593021 [Lasiosphaeria ovina]|uniref:Rhamnogalacturonase A/B/Epimerase-like pectate lyase domain-containing protein n=1 Tax=Lasiosphaeria ovina TaxID=92902 RepID=A0AAE0KJZ3_9PEZI|nr:hypothetical protein B0T24DRAFT_593021 [Lasiosphaeria ovina]